MIRECCGKLGWPLREFWATSLPEIFLALEGLAEFHGAKKDDDEPLSQEEIEELVEADKSNGHGT